MENNDSPFKISITGYPTDNCLPGGGPGIDKFEVMYLHGIGKLAFYMDCILLERKLLIIHCCSSMFLLLMNIYVHTILE